MTVLPLPPFAVVLIGLALFVVVIFTGLLLMGRDRPAPGWEAMSPGWLALTVVGAVVWTGLFLMIVVAAFEGLRGAMETPEATSLGLGGLLVALLGAPFLIWTTWLKHRTVEFQKEGHMTDRISKAVEQLGAEKTVKKVAGGQTVETTEPNLEVRIGAILSLERIAQDSTRHDKGRDHVRVMEILCAYIRHNAPAREAKDHGFGEWEPLPDDATAAERAARPAARSERVEKVSAWARTLSPPRADIAEALKVIGRRTPAQLRVEAAWPKPPEAGTEWPFDEECPILADEPGEAPQTPAKLKAYRDQLKTWCDRVHAYRGYRIDLRETNLQKADLAAASLQGARLGGVRMEGADVREAWMEGADLRNARMQGADLSWARMEGADLWKARMEGADLSWAQMKGAYLGGVRMEGAFLDSARMEGTDLSRTQMEGAYLSRARMEGADLRGARMEGANLYLARMQGANFSDVRMEEVVLSEARMEGAYLSGARMGGADLSEARMDASTKLSGTSLTEGVLRLVDLSDVAITRDQIRSAFGDASVVLPHGVTPGHSDWPAHWPLWALPDYGPNGFTTQWEKWRANPAIYRPPPPP